MIGRSDYPSDWEIRARACKVRDGWKCTTCGVKQYTVIVPSLDALVVVVDPVVDHPKMVHLHAAHVHHDKGNPDAELETQCASCHSRRDYAYKQLQKRLQLEQLKHRVLLSARAVQRWYWRRGIAV